MNTSANSIKHVSDTAFWMATYRGMEGDRADALFRDPLAKVLAGDYGRRISASMKPYSQYAYWTLVIRTCVIDELLSHYLGQGCQTVINIGAGLDTRPYRLELPRNTRWIEIDFPDVIAFKQEKLAGETPCCELQRLGVDLSNHAERQALFHDLNERLGPAIILTEGVIPYLTETQVGELAQDLHAQDNFKLWIGEYYSPSVYPRYQSEAFKKRLGNSPFQFFPTDWFGFFRDRGWREKEVLYLYDEAEKLGRLFPLPWWVKLLGLFISKEKIRANTRVSAYIVYLKT